MAEYPPLYGGPVLFYCYECDTYWERSTRWLGDHGAGGIRATSSKCQGLATTRIPDEALQAAHMLGGWQAVLDMLGPVWQRGDDTLNRSARMAFKEGPPW